MTQIRRYLKTLLTALALLMPLGAWASGDSKKALIDMDFELKEFNVNDGEGWGGFSGKAHFWATNDEFIITIPAQTVTRKTNYEVYTAKLPAITVKGKCKVERATYGGSPHFALLPVGNVTVSPTNLHFDIAVKIDGTETGYKATKDYVLSASQEPWFETAGIIRFFINAGFASNGSVNIGLKWDKLTRKPLTGTTLADYHNPDVIEYKWGEYDGALSGQYLYISGKVEEVKVSEGDITASAEDDTEAPDEKGPWGTAIPAAVAAGIIGYLTHLINKLRKRRKGNAKDQQDEDDSDDNEEEDDDDEEEPDQLEMKFYKDFDGTLISGDVAQRVSACIVRHPAKGGEWVDENLTRQIEITSADNYLEVEDDGMVNGWRSCFVSAPQDDNPPEEGVVKFRLSVDRGTYTNRVHFRIEKGEIQFGQENLTIPAQYESVLELPFLVPGFEGENGVTAYITDSEGNEGDYGVDVYWDAQKKHHFAHIRDKVKDPAKDEGIPGQYLSYTLHVEAKNDRGTKLEGTLPVLRFYMGLAVEFKDKGEIGCYITEYDPMKHRTRPELRIKAGSKQYMSQENQAILTLYDYDISRNTLLKISPIPLRKDGFTVKAKDESKQEFVDKLGLQMEALTDRCDEGRLCLIRSLKGVLDAPNRIDAECIIKVEYQGPNNPEPKIYTCTHAIRLASQPRREVQDMNSAEAFMKEDQHTYDRLMHIIESVVQTGQLNRMFPLVKYTEMQIEGYDAAYGYDKRNVNRIRSTYARLVMGDIGGVDEELPPELGIKDELEWWFEAIKQVEKDIGFIGRIVAGVGSWGLSELIFMPVDFAEEIREYVYDKNGDSMLKMFWIGIKNGAFMVLGATGAASTIKAKNLTRQGMREAIQNAKKGFEKPYNTLKGWLFRESAEKSLEATRRASSVAEMRLNAAKNAPRLPGDLNLDKAMATGRANAAEKVKNLRAAIEMAEQNGEWTNVALKNRLILEVQGDKQAMYMLKNASSKYDVVRKELNGTLKNIYEITDAKSIAELSKKYPGRKIRVMNATSSKAEQLASGKTITMDRDITYYFVDENNVTHYLPHEEVVEVYNRNFYETTRRFTSKSNVIADSSASSAEVYGRYAKGKDQTVIQDVLHDNESFGVDWEKLADKSRHGEALTNPTKVGDAMTFKGYDRFQSAEKMLKEAETITNEAERLLVQSEAVNEYMEGLRQMAKEFNNFVKPYDIARYKVNGTSMIPQHMREAVEMVEDMFKAGSTVSIDQIQRAFRSMNYSFYQFADDMGACMKRITTAKSWEIAK
ncbi:hypothetical protein SAMN05216462_0804 [Xylanibacter ruminicola]|uniref:Uncharacterized protein n=2 Tax=Xylanibacter ruminicola TaxID=839 RepID=A0A1H3YVC4_XYLRU|nr:hypothetical protein [Xylanibacter ruminicola]SEA14974.1 hypothetical protein SAMN05216462_0804 [Xylanibacter ruminicola]